MEDIPNYGIHPPSEEEVRQAKYFNYAAGLMLDKGKTAAEVKQMMITQGVDPAKAEMAVVRVEEQIAAAKKEKGKKDMLYGALWCIGGIAVTAITYSAASGGGSYVVAWGAILFGGVQFIRGMINS